MKLFKTTSPQKLFPSYCITLYNKNTDVQGDNRIFDGGGGKYSPPTVRI